jgi:hypothetical protein
MRVSFLTILGRLLGALLLVAGLWGLGGCDTAPAPEETQRPSVSNLQLVPDSIHQSDLPPDQVQDSTAQVPLNLSARATDPDGTVVRVVFVLEPSSNPRGAISSRLPAQSQSPSLYGGQLALSLPLVDEIYTIRAFAVDDDSLASNQVTGQLRFVPTDSSNTSAALALSK